MKGIWIWVAGGLALAVATVIIILSIKTLEVDKIHNQDNEEVSGIGAT